jgi:conjugative transfer signal peptidase TraF
MFPGGGKKPLRGGHLVVGAVLAVGTAVSALAGPPVVLLNTSPSEPLGIYFRTAEAPAVGRIVAFRLPAAAFAYVDQTMPYLRRRPLLKSIAAGPGDQVCTEQGSLAINGARRAPISRQDPQGRSLPQWSGCRRLGADEFFVYSPRVPNSFDSRYYGPVHRDAILGSYRWLAVDARGGA